MNDTSARLSLKIVTHIHLAHSNCDYGCEISNQSLLTCHTNTMERQVREMSPTHDRRVAMQHHRTTSQAIHTHPSGGTNVTDGPLLGIRS